MTVLDTHVDPERLTWARRELQAALDALGFTVTPGLDEIKDEHLVGWAEALAAKASGQSEYLPLVDCAPWCRIGDGHPNEWHPDDQWCGSEGERVKLSR